MVFRVELRDRAAFASGWGIVEYANGLAYRWMEAERAVLAVTSPRPWQALRVHCRFADAVRRDVSIEVTASPGDEPAVGTLRWLGRGMHHQRVVLDRPVPAGVSTVQFDAVQTWMEPGGTRSLSVAFAAIGGWRQWVQPLSRPTARSQASGG